MIELSRELVLLSVAEHLELPPEALSLEQNLARDLGLDALDLVLVVLRLEQIEPSEFPIAALDDVETLGELVLLIRAWSRLARASEPTPTRSEACTTSTSTSTSTSSSGFRLRATVAPQIRTRRTGTE